MNEQKVREFVEINRVSGKQPRPKILIVDDARENITAMEHVLSDLDIDLVTSTDPYKALSYTLEHDFALALIDVQMPLLNGYQTAEKMRSAEHSCHIPIMFVTANSLDERSVMHGYGVGAIDYIEKPLNPYVLKSKVNMFVELYRNKLALKEVSREVKEEKGSAESLSEIESSLVANISSELKTPLHSIIGMTDMGVINIDKWDKVRQIDNLREINSNSRTLLLLLNDIIDLSRLEAGLMGFNYSKSDMVSIVRDVVKSLKPLMYEEGILAEIESNHEPLFVEFDTARIGQVILNVISSAIERTPVNGVIKINISEVTSSSDECRKARVSIADCGGGIPDELISSLFDKFSQVISLRGRDSNTSGLGLAVCKKIIDQHGGFIRIENNAGMGAVVSFDIPVKQSCP